jgi:thiamine pyrophosphokinase
MGGDHGPIIMKRIFIVANGTLDRSFLRQIRKSDFLIGVDRAAYWLIQNKKIPHAAIGDFDSVASGDLGSIKKRVTNVILCDTHKDATDTELAMEYAVKLRPKEILVTARLAQGWIRP